MYEIPNKMFIGRVCLGEIWSPAADLCYKIIDNGVAAPPITLA